MSRLLPLGLIALLAVVATAQELPPTPQRVPIRSRKLPKGHAVRRRALAPVSVPLDNFFRGTDLQWFGNISVGAPPQNVSVVFDTGSITLEFATTECSSCTQSNRFDISKSTTFVRGNRNTSLEFSTGVGVDPVARGDYILKLQSGMDTVSVGGIAVHNVSLFTITEQTPKFNIDPFIGIQGMGVSDEPGLFSGLISQGLPSLFGMYLTPHTVGDAELLIGGIDNSKFTGNLTYLPLIPQDTKGAWIMQSRGLTVNGASVAVPPQQGLVLFDSGTSNILFDTKTTEAMYALISPDIKPFAAEPGAYGLPCSQLDGLAAQIDLTFADAAGAPFNLTVPSSELNVGPFASDPSVCQTLINAFDDGPALIGGSLLKHYYSVWDVGARRMGFAPSVAAAVPPSNSTDHAPDGGPKSPGGSTHVGIGGGLLWAGVLAVFLADWS